MKLTFLGTGTSKGIPVIGSTNEVCLSNNIKDNRLRTSALISWGNFNFVIDCGPDFRQQMLRENISKIDGIIYTHEHSDHTAGLDDIRPFTQRYGDLPIYAYERIINDLKKRFGYIFTTKNKYPSAPSVIVNTIKNKPFILGDIEVIPIEVEHGKLSVSFINDLEKKKLNNLNILVINALGIKDHPTHFNLEKALKLIDEVKPKKAYITHISHKLGFHDIVEKQLPKNVFLAYDGLKIES